MQCNIAYPTDMHQYLPKISSEI